MSNIISYKVKKGDVIFLENDVADCAYIIESGSIELLINNNGLQSRISKLAEGAMFGEMALIDRHQRSATAVASEDSELIVIPNKYFNDKLVNSDKFILLLLKTIQQRYREMRCRLDRVLQESEFRKHLDVNDDIKNDLEQTAAYACIQIKAEQNLKLALEKNELVLFFQPIIALKDFSVVGCEALIRWQHPREGLVMPSEFIELAEQTGLIVPMGRWIIEEAVQAFSRFVDSGLNLEFISINLSGKQFGNADLISNIKQIFEFNHVDPGKVKFEITESILMDKSVNIDNILGELKALGSHIAIDDFGTGYSSFAYLHQFPIDTLKIDKSFVYSMSYNHKSYEIVRSLCVLAKAIGLNVVAEGVESAKELTMLKELGVEYVQGYYFAKPMSSDDFKIFQVNTDQ